MSWFNNLVETYDRCTEIIGIPDPNDDRKILLPLNHMFMESGICITIDGNGSFLSASADKKKIVIPCTEDSASRSGKAKFPHPLHEQLGYLALNEEKHDEYMKLLEEWAELHPKVMAVKKYCLRNTILEDLGQSGIEVQSGDKDLDKLLVRFSVEIPYDHVPHLWEDKSIAKAWQSFCAAQENQEESLCYITGKVDVISRKHPKGVNPITNGAKLISSNDETNYTYKGRFTKSEQANAISMQASQKAHAMLRYLIATQGYKCDTQAIVAWAIDDGSVQPNAFSDSLGLYADAKEDARDKLIEIQGDLSFDYATNLRNALSGFGKPITINDYARRVAIIAEDAATTGRMSITFYQQLTENEYIDRLCDWHESCKWFFRYRRKEFVSAPSGDRIIAAVYGEPKGENYNKIKKQARERILNIIMRSKALDFSWVTAALNRVSNPLSFNDVNGSWDRYKWETAISVVCALARKYYIGKKEVFPLALETTRPDRDYLFGRLLALADNLESHARYLQTQGNSTEKRPTNAVRYMQRFAVKPYSTWGLIFEQLNPYIQRLNGAEGYQRQIDDILSLFAPEDFMSDKRLTPLYLMGYSLQRRALYRKETYREEDNEFNEED